MEPIGISDSSNGSTTISKEIKKSQPSQYAAHQRYGAKEADLGKFFPEETLQDRCGVLVEKGTLDGILVVRKKYDSNRRYKYISEKNNLACMRETGLRSFVDSTAEDDNTPTLFFPYVEGRNGYDAIQTGDPVATLSRILESLVEEATYLNEHNDLPFSYIPFGYKTEPHPFTYCQLLTQKSGLLKTEQFAELQKLLRTPLPEPRWGRYDPEISNVIVVADRVAHIDYESMSLQDNLFAFAYALVHLELVAIPQDLKNAVGGKKFLDLAKDCTIDTLCTNTEFENRMRLNIAEVCGYLFLETMRMHPNNNDLTVKKKLRTVRNMLEETLAV